MDEPSIINGFADSLGTQVVGRMPMDDLIPMSEIRQKTVMEYAPGSDIAETSKNMGKSIAENRNRSVPEPLFDEEPNHINKRIEDMFREKALTKRSI